MPIKTAVCVKNAIDPSEIMVDEGDTDIDLDFVPTKMSDYDDRAIETALQIRDEFGGEVTGLTVGTDEANTTLRETLAYEVDDVILIEDPVFEGKHPTVTANALAGAVSSLADIDLIICGAMSEDTYTKQVPARLSALLDWPLFANVTELEVTETTVTARQDVGEGIEVTSGSLPAVVSVQYEINKPRYISRRQMLQVPRNAGTQWTFSDVGIADQGEGLADSQVTKMRPLFTERKNVTIEKETDEAITELWTHLSEEGVVE